MSFVEFVVLSQSYKQQNQSKDMIKKMPMKKKMTEAISMAKFSS